MASDWGKFNWEDPFNLDEQLTEEERLIRDSAASFAAEKLEPRVTQAFRDESTDRKIFNEMGELGLLGATIDGHGCPGVSYVSYGLIAREVECRLRLSVNDERSIKFGDVPHLYLWYR